MKKLVLIWTFCSTVIFYANAQNAESIQKATDSLIVFFENGLKNTAYNFTELIKSPDDFFADENGEITGDTIMLENYEHFKFYRTRKKDSLFIAEYYRGKIGNLFEKELTVYYFLSGRLAMTIAYFLKHGESLDDGVGTYYFREERRLLFPSKGGIPSYIMRDGEGTTDNFDIKRLPFKQIDVKKIVYNKYNYEIIGEKIFNGKTDF